MLRTIVASVSLTALIGITATAQDVAVMYDAALPTLGLPDAPGFAAMIVDELDSRGVSAEVVDSVGLAEYMEANPEGIMLVCQGIMPGTIFKAEGKDDLIYGWLRDGGIGGFVGDYPFYYWDAVANAPGGGGQVSVFGVTVTNGTLSTVVPTALGEELIPSLGEWTSNRAVGLGVLEANGFEYESYADDGANADPIAYRTEDMKGWFVNLHTSCCGTVVPANDLMAVEYAELISNRFAAGLAVGDDNKAATAWGRLKRAK
jgi:hypothetical protein